MLAKFLRELGDFPAKLDIQTRPALQEQMPPTIIIHVSYFNKTVLREEGIFLSTRARSSRKKWFLKQLFLKQYRILLIWLSKCVLYFLEL